MVMALGFYAGMLQVNVRVLGNAPSGDVSVMLIVGSASSQPGVTVAVQIKALHKKSDRKPNVLCKAVK